VLIKFVKLAILNRLFDFLFLIFMKPIIIWLAIILLLFSSAGAFYGGYQLVAHPDGSSLKLSFELLKNTPFPNFKIPGIAFFITVGIFGAITIIFTFQQQQYHAKYITGAGLLLTVWILVEMALAPEIYRRDYIALFLGIAQMLCGLYLDRRKEEENLM